MYLSYEFEIQLEVAPSNDSNFLLGTQQKNVKEPLFGNIQIIPI